MDDMGTQLGTVRAVELTLTSGGHYTVRPDTPIWTSGIADLSPETVPLDRLPRLVYEREPAWIFLRDRTAEPEEGWTPDTDDPPNLPVVHGVFVPAVVSIAVIYDEEEADG